MMKKPVESKRLEMVMENVYRAFVQTEIEALDGEPSEWTLQITDVNGKRSSHITFKELTDYIQKQGA